MWILLVSYLQSVSQLVSNKRLSSMLSRIPQFLQITSQTVNKSLALQGITPLLFYKARHVNTLVHRTWRLNKITTSHPSVLRSHLLRKTILLYKLSLAQSLPLLTRLLLIFFHWLQISIRLPSVEENPISCGRLIFSFLIFIHQPADVLTLLRIKLPQELFIDITSRITSHFLVLLGNGVLTR